MIPVCRKDDKAENRKLYGLTASGGCERFVSKGTQNFINVRVLKVRLFWAADQTLPIPDIRKTLQVLSCKVCCGDSWTRTNDPIDVNDVLSLCG